MSNLNSKFDMLRGWPNGSALSYEFKEKDSITDLVEGTVVAVEDESGVAVVDRHQSAANDHPWMVVQGTDQYDGDFTGMTTCVRLRTGVVFKVETVLTPAVAAPLWSDVNGVFTDTDPGGGEPPLGKVLSFDSDDGVMTVES
jgi:hypothetical protein